jgi:hypothetical protein
MAESHNKTTKKIRGWNVVEPTVYQDDSGQARVNLRPDDFDALIKQQGIFLNVYRSVYCPNVKSIDGGEHNFDCPMCNGSGILDKYPITVRGVIQSQNNVKSLQMNGYQDDNEVLISIPTGIEIQYFTLIELKDFTDIYFQRVARSQGLIDNLKYKAKRVNMLIDQNGIEYDEGIDFNLTQDGQVQWKQNKGPDSEVIYSIHYEALVQFRATKAIHVNRFTQAKADNGIAHMKMSEQWMCTKEFLVRNKDVNGNDMIQNPIPKYEDETPE